MKIYLLMVLIGAIAAASHRKVRVRIAAGEHMTGTSAEAAAPHIRAAWAKDGQISGP